MLSPTIIEIATFSASMAALAVVVIVLPGLVLAWLLARREFIGKSVVETLVTLPLVIPPVATGLILLRVFGRRGPLGAALARVGIEIPFTWKAVVLAMAVMAFPLLVRTVRAGFEQMGTRYEQMAATLGARPIRVFLTISLPLARRAILAGVILAFSRALGEFGATIMVAGMIPGQTLTLPGAIFNFVETNRDEQALAMVALSITIAFAAIWMSNHLEARER